MTDRGLLLQHIADTAEDLCDPRQHTEPILDTDQHGNKRLRRAYTVTMPSLLDQLAEAAMPAGEPGASGSYGSRPPANLDAVSKWGAIQIGSVGLAWRLRVDARSTVAGTIRACVGAAASATSDDQRFTLAELRRWRRWAAIATGWETHPQALRAPCPLCNESGCLRATVRNGKAEAWCDACNGQWSEADDNMGLLARHLETYEASARANADVVRARSRAAKQPVDQRVEPNTA